jgi:catenin alpha
MPVDEDDEDMRRLMRHLPEEEKEKIQAEISEFKEQKTKFDRQVDCYDDHSNDIIVLAKKMCLIMMQMTDFTRGTGPLKTTNDVIKAAQNIAQYGNELNLLANAIAMSCPDQSTRQDLLAYLAKIIALSHQLTMCAQVKAEVQQIAGEMVVSGIDGATSLIQAAKNLMSAVVSSVKYSYVASTQAKRTGTQEGPIIVWKMKAPEKKPLIRKDKKGDRQVPRRRESRKDHNTNHNEALQNYEHQQPVQ